MTDLDPDRDVDANELAVWLGVTPTAVRDAARRGVLDIVVFLEFDFAQVIVGLLAVGRLDAMHIHSRAHAAVVPSGRPGKPGARRGFLQTWVRKKNHGTVADDAEFAEQADELAHLRAGVLVAAEVVPETLPE